MSVGFRTFHPKQVNTVFTVKNVASSKKVVKIFNYPIPWNMERDLLTIPEVSEADIRHSLLKGTLAVKLRAGEIRVTNSTIDLLQFDTQQRSFLINAGVSAGLDATVIGGSGGLDETQHSRLRQLIHLNDIGGPMEGFASLAFREILPAADPFPDSIIWWESSAKLKKIMETNITRDGSENPTIIQMKVYDEDGTTVLAIVTDTITYSGSFETVRTRTIA